MPREPRTTFSTWSLTAALATTAGLPSGCGLLYVFASGRDPERWPEAANDEKAGSPQASVQEVL